MRIIQCQRCDADIIGGNNRRYCTPCGEANRISSRKAAAARNRALNDALRLMADKSYRPRSRAMTGEGGE